MIKKVAFDIDGVLTDPGQDIENAFLQFYRMKKGCDYKGNIDTSRYELIKEFPAAEKFLIEEFLRVFWPKEVQIVSARKYAKELFFELRKRGCEIHIITARGNLETSKANDKLEEQTRVWLEQNGLVPDVMHYAREDKAQVIRAEGIELMVEDTPDMAVQCAYACPVFLIDHPYNRLTHGRNIWRINGFEPAAFIDLIKYANEHKIEWEDRMFYQLPEKDTTDLAIGEDYEEAAELEKTTQILLSTFINGAFSGICTAYNFDKEMVKSVETYLKWGDEGFVPISEMKVVRKTIVTKKGETVEEIDVEDGTKYNPTLLNKRKLLKGKVVASFSVKGKTVLEYTLIRGKGKTKVLLKMDSKRKKYADYYKVMIGMKHGVKIDSSDKWLTRTYKKIAKGSVTDKEREMLHEESFQEAVNEMPITFEVLNAVEGIVRFNGKSKSNIIFFIPFKNPNTGHKVINQFRLNNLDFCHINLNLLDKDQPDTPDTKEGNLIVRKCLERAVGRKELDLNDEESTEVYRVKVDAISRILKYIQKKKNKLFVVEGVQLLLLPRNINEKYSSSCIYLEGVTQKDIVRIQHSKYKDGYNPWIVLEDLTDVPTQVRKWRIIAGTAEKELPGYHNRQTTTADGVDIIRFLKGERPYKPDLIKAILSENTFLIGDPHISKHDRKKTQMIQNSVNKRVGKDDHLVILGDLDGKRGSGNYEETKRFLSGIHCKNLYLILGNNDPYKIRDYVRLGFKSVVIEAEYEPSPVNRVLLTHCPVPVELRQINIHGHIHGSRCYWNVDWHNHYDVWDEQFVPITIGEVLQILERGLYTARSENHNIY